MKTWMFAILMQFSIAAQAQETSFSHQGLDRPLSLQGQAVISDLMELTELIRSESEPKVSQTLEFLGAAIEITSVTNTVERDIKKDCLIFGEGSFCQSQGLSRALSELPAIEYNYILTHWILPQYMEDLNFQIAVDSFYPIHSQWIDTQIQSEDVSLSRGGRIVDGAVMGVSAFLGYRGVRSLIKNRRAMAQWLRMKSSGQSRLPVVVSAPQSQALAKYQPQTFWSTKRGIYTQFAVSAVTGATCRSVATCGFDTEHYRANMMLALQLTQTEMACQMVEQANTLTEELNASDASARETKKPESSELLNRMLYLFSAHTHLQDYQRNASDPNGSFRALLDQLTRADGWFENFKSLCPEAKMAESYFLLLNALEPQQ